MSKSEHGTDAITPAVVAKAARLARIALSPAEEAATAVQLERVRAWATTLQDVAVEDVAPMMHPHEGPMPLRADVDSGQTLTAAEVLANAPSHAEHHFVVPRVVG